MSLSADASVHIIILGYLQSFELAMLTGEHTLATYYNATQYGSTEYLALYRHTWTDQDDQFQTHDMYTIIWKVSTTVFNDSLWVAAKAGQLECINLLIGFGANAINFALKYATESCQLQAIMMLVELGAQYPYAISDELWTS